MKKKTAAVKKTVVKKIEPKKIRLIVLGLALVGLLIYLKSLLIVAIVNNRPIFRWTYTKELNKVAGKQTLESLITKSLIDAEANKQKVKITKEELDAEIAKIEEFAKQQGADLNQLLELQGMKRQDLINDVRLQKLVEKMAGTESAQIQSWLTNLQTQAKVIKWIK